MIIHSSILEAAAPSQRFKPRRKRWESLSNKQRMKAIFLTLLFQSKFADLVGLPYMSKKMVETPEETWKREQKKKMI